MKFYKCNKCGNVVLAAVDSGVVPFCCGEKIDDCKLRIQVGSVEHPMLPEHHISFIYVEFASGGGRLINLKDKPSAEVCVCGEKVVAVYEYCNLHGLWKTEL